MKALSRTNRLRKQGGSIPTVFVRRPLGPVGRSSVLQWTIAGVVGIVLGIYTLGVSSFPGNWAALLVLAVLGPTIALVVGNVRKLLLGIILLDIPLQLDANLAYQTEAAALGALGGLNVSVTTGALIVLYALWLGGLLARVESVPRPILRRSLPLALYVAFVALSVVVARDVTLALFELFLLAQMFLLYVYVASTVRTRQDVLFVVTLLLIGLVLESLIMIGVYAAGRDFSIAGISTRVDTSQGSRVGGLFRSPNAAATYLSLLLAPALSLLLLRGVGLWYKQLAALAFGLGAIALVLTLSRGGWIAFTLSSTILCLLAWRRGWLSLRVPFAVAVVAVLLGLLFQDAIVGRLFGDDNGAARARLPLMRLAFRMIEDNPVLGIGANNFAIMIKQYATPEFAREWLYVVHNMYLLRWAEIGIGGLLAFIAFLVVTVRRGWQCWKFRDQFLSPLALGFTAAIIGHMVHMFVDLFTGRMQVELLWLTAGLITAMRNIDSDG